MLNTKCKKGNSEHCKVRIKDALNQNLVIFPCVFMWINRSRFLPRIHRSQAAPQSFPPFSFSPASSSPQRRFDPGRCHHHCRSSPHLPSSSSCAYGTLEMGRKTGKTIIAASITTSYNLSRWWLIVLLSDIPTGATFTPASCRSSPLASSIRHASRQHWMAASFFFPVWVTSATSWRPMASSTGSLTETSTWTVGLYTRHDLSRYRHIFWKCNHKSGLSHHSLYSAEPAAVTFVFILKLQLLS